MKLSNLEQKIFDVLSPVADSIGYDIVKVRFDGSARKVLDISIDKLDMSPVTIADCRNASNNFSAVLDVEEIIPDRYFLEVGSAGVERPLVKEKDFEKFQGREISVKLHKALNDTKRFNGKNLGLKDAVLTILLKSGDELKLDYENVKSANLVFTDEMFRESLSKNN